MMKWGRGRKGDIPLRERIIHIKNAVKVRASGKMRSSTIQSGAFCISAIVHVEQESVVDGGMKDLRQVQPQQFRQST